VSALTKNLKPLWEQFSLPIVSLLSKLRLSPHALTVAGLALSAISVFPLSEGNFFWGGLLVAAGGVCDALDGHLARRTGKVSKFGALLDSTLDRLADFFPLMGLALYFSGNSVWLSVVLLNIAFWFLVSYVKARLEGLGIKEKIGGLFERPERLAVLIITLLIGFPEIGLIITLAGSIFTFLQRMYIGYKLLKKT